MAESKTFCALPWNHLASSADGSLRLCCLARSMPGINFGKHTLSEAWSSPEIVGARELMLNGQPVRECNTCYIEEKNGKKSQRLMSNERWGVGPVEKLQSLDLRLGNVCNLQCVMCRPQESSKWKQLAQNLASRAHDSELRNGFQQNLTEALTAPDWFNSENWLRDFQTHLPNLREIILGGGEPLLSARHGSLLEACVESGHSQHISLRYHTNGTLLDEKLFSLWDRFELVEVYVSLDDLGARNHYIRYPAKFEAIEKNLKSLDAHSSARLKFRILNSVQALNMLYLPEFAGWIESQRFSNLGYSGWYLPNIVHDPKYLSVQIYPEGLKKLVTAKLRAFENSSSRPTPQIESVIQFMNQQDESHRLPQFREYIRLLDSERGTDFAGTFPELAEWLFAKSPSTSSPVPIVLAECQTCSSTFAPV